MRGLKTLLTLTLLVNWFACIAHCHLEKAGFIRETACHHILGSHSDSESNGHDDSQVCDWVNSEGLKAADVRVFAPEALTFLCARVLATDLYDGRRSPDSCRVTDRSVTPPELVHTFQFVLRTALPARAPSLVS